ncbi:SusC/RagA family TonB-linked outer membrane protein [Chitinophaga polysaccharea]|uniref:SusC/RagA family TonB-linked outer membrane protein n=1 Tax=Chitinophaga polysaccharea TaxID=1293035 RepID=UPI00115B1572|nr:SusC/RagA family TonB-linked outer membrane protein [Chitinophaga polysaccharea]
MNYKIHRRTMHKNKCITLRSLGVPEKYGLNSWFRFIFLLIFFTFLYLAASAQKVSVNVTDRPLKEVLQSLRQQSGYAFIFNDQLMAKAKPVTLNVKDKEILQVLPLTFKGQPLGYEINGKVITVTPTVPTKTIINKEQRPFKGSVADSLGRPLANVTVRIKNSDQVTRSDNSGNFYLRDLPDNAVITMSLLGYRGQEINDPENGMTIIMQAFEGMLSEAVVTVNTGYQSISRERATGSFVVIDSAIINRRVSTNIIDRLDGVTSGLYFNGMDRMDIPEASPGDRLGISIRGESSLLSAKDPLVVLDNFPYAGEIKNINPNDIESITILKDAAAASIWGARAGNGVIVITTKKGKIGSKMSFTVNSNLTITSKPDLYNVKNYLQSSDYIEVEKFLFTKGIFNQDLVNTTTFTPVSPVVEILDKEKRGLISSAEAEEQINYIKSRDVREDFNKYVYQPGVRQQYSIGIRGGTNNLAYSLSAGFDKSNDVVKRNGFNRATINSYNTYTPIKNLEISFGINYTNSNTALNNLSNTFGNASYALGGWYTEMLPYAQLMGENGNPSSILKGYTSQYIERLKALGYKDWYYRPIDEINNANYNTNVNDILFRLGIKYKFGDNLNLDLQYSNERQRFNTENIQGKDSYYARNLVNRFTQTDQASGRLINIFPDGAIFNKNSADWLNNNFRAQLNYENKIGKHLISGLAGFEIRELKSDTWSQTLYGYDEQFGTSVGNFNYQQSYPILPTGSSTIPVPSNSMDGNLERYVSYFANASYIYDDKYQVTLSARKDGSNIFGVNTNKKVTPLWSAGLGWTINKEQFYGLSDVIPYLKLRASYGYNGNLRNTSAFLNGYYFNDAITGYNSIRISSPPNPELRWEKVRNINWGLDFAALDNRINGTIEYYHKEGSDLLQNTPLASQTGFINYISNAAKTRTKGLDVILNSTNIKGAFNWSSNLLLSTISDKLITYDPKPTSFYLQANGAPTPIVGYPLYGIFSYKWEGLDPENGDPIGWLNGGPSKNYSAIMNNISPDSVNFHGSSRPKIFGGFRNDFSYKRINLSINLVYKLDYYFRRTSTSLNYTDILGMYQHVDYNARWQKPGDENFTSVPSLVYPSNSRRNSFYRYSGELVESGDHIRFQDIRLGYSLPKSLIDKIGFRKFEVYGYVQNLGIIWRKNKLGIDPDAPGSGGSTVVDIKDPTSYSFGITAEF